MKPFSPADAVRIRLLNQQLAAPQFKEPAEVVSHFGAMQAQEYRLMRWGVAMRTKLPSARAFKNAFNDGRIIRLHLLRGTWQLVSGEDYWWMLDLCADRAERVIRGWMSANGISLPEDELQEVREILAQTAGNLGSVTKKDFDDALVSKGIVMDNHRLTYHIRMAELSGLLCSGDLQPMKATYSLAETKIGPRRILDRDEELMMLTRKYFQSHAPATFEDFVWWSGISVADCKRGIELLGNELLRAGEFYILESCRTRGFRKGHALLVPPYDEYLIGYKSRYLVLPDEFQARAHNRSGIFYPVVAHDGMICGNWTPFQPELSLDFFTEDGKAWNERDLWKRYRGFRTVI